MNILKVAGTHTKDIFGETKGAVKKTFSQRKTRIRSRSSPHKGTIRRSFSGSSFDSKRSTFNRESDQHIFCSDTYSIDFIMSEMQKVEIDPWIVKLTFEDLLCRESAEMEALVYVFLCQTSWKDQEQQEQLGVNTNSSSKKKSPSFVGPGASAVASKRHWESITFLDVVSTAADYRVYLDRKEKFLVSLNELATEQGMDHVLPVKFLCTLEIHSAMELFSILELLKEVERDATVKRVKTTPRFIRPSGKRELVLSTSSASIGSQFLKNVDADALEWTGEPIQFHLRYHYEDMNVPGAKCPKANGCNSSTIHQCAQALENLLSPVDD